MTRLALRLPLAAALVVAGLLALPAAAEPRTTAAAAAPGVVALVDTGINPYNVVFRDRSPLAQRYPGTYLPGYPRNVPALRLSLDAPSYAAALARDCDRVWRHVKVGQLYWIPGTKIVGAISFNPNVEVACPGMPGTAILDAAGHGTMTASRAVATGYGACPQCRVVEVQAVEDGVGVETLTDDLARAERGISWAAANNGWIDAQSNSWGPALPYDPTGQTGILSGNPTLARTVESAAQRMLAFFASGNGAANLDLPPPRTTLGWSDATPSSIVVGGEDSGHMLSWPNVPVHLAADACDDWGASATSTTDSSATTGGGTSAATPYVAAGAVAELVAARRLLGDPRSGVHDGVVARGPRGRVRSGPLADGALTLAEWRTVLFDTATARPVAEPTDGPQCALVFGTPAGPAWASLPPQFPEYLSIGYGVVDAVARAHATAVLAGRLPLPDRASTDRFFTAYDAATQASYRALTSLP